jgi:hypothetical protein
MRGRLLPSTTTGCNYLCEAAARQGAIFVACDMALHAGH